MGEMNSANTGDRVYDKNALFKDISDVSFVLDELRLYLDTHPDCAEALEMFGNYQKMRREFIEEYTENYGPVDSYFVNTDEGWTWASQKMPWENQRCSGERR